VGREWWALKTRYTPDKKDGNIVIFFFNEIIYLIINNALFYRTASNVFESMIRSASFE